MELRSRSIASKGPARRRCPRRATEMQPLQVGATQAALRHAAAHAGSSTTSEHGFSSNLSRKASRPRKWWRGNQKHQAQTPLHQPMPMPTVVQSEPAVQADSSASLMSASASEPPQKGGRPPTKRKGPRKQQVDKPVHPPMPTPIAVHSEPAVYAGNSISRVSVSRQPTPKSWPPTQTAEGSREGSGPHTSLSRYTHTDRSAI